MADVIERRTRTTWDWALAAEGYLARKSIREWRLRVGPFRTPWRRCRV